MLSKNLFTSKPLTVSQNDIDPQKLISILDDLENEAGEEVEDGVKKSVKAAVDSFYNNVDTDVRSDKLYIGNTILKDIEDKNLSQLENLFKLDDRGRVTIASAPTGGDKGIRYEHILPYKQIGIILKKLYTEAKGIYGDEFDPALYGEAALNLIGSLYSIAYVDVIQDKNLESGGYQSRIANSKVTDIDGIVNQYIEAMIDGKIDEIELKNIEDFILDRYDISGIGVTKLDDAFGGNDSLPLGIPRKALADTTTLEESKKPTLTNMLFGYYG